MGSGYYAEAMAAVAVGPREAVAERLAAAAHRARLRHGRDFHGEFHLLAGVIAVLAGAAEPEPIRRALAPAVCPFNSNPRTNWALMRLLAEAVFDRADPAPGLDRVLGDAAVPWEGGVFLRDARDDYSTGYHAFSTVLLQLLELSAARAGRSWAHGATLAGARRAAARLANDGATVWLGRGQYQLFGAACLDALVDGSALVAGYRPGSIVPATLGISSPEWVDPAAASRRRHHHGYNNAQDYHAFARTLALTVGLWPRQAAMAAPARIAFGEALALVDGAAVRAVERDRGKCDLRGLPFLGCSDAAGELGDWAARMHTSPTPGSPTLGWRIRVRLGLASWPPRPPLRAAIPAPRVVHGSGAWTFESDQLRGVLEGRRCRLELGNPAGTDHWLVHAPGGPPPEISGGTAWPAHGPGAAGLVIQPSGPRSVAEWSW